MTGPSDEDATAGFPGRPAERPPATGFPDPDPPERYLDEHAGPLVRPYVMTGGRMRPIRGEFNLVTLVMATGLTPAPELGLGPEHMAVVRLCDQAMSVAEIAGHLKLPTVTVRVLLGDLLDKGLVTAQDPQPETRFMTDDDMYRAVLDGLQAL